VNVKVMLFFERRGGEDMQMRMKNNSKSPIEWRS
jgi:hypothetical protein